jgi:hypothetical protein
MLIVFDEHQSGTFGDVSSGQTYLVVVDGRKVRETNKWFFEMRLNELYAAMQNFCTSVCVSHDNFRMC